MADPRGYAVNVPQETWDMFVPFMRANRFRDAGKAIHGLLSRYRDMLDIKAEYVTRSAELDSREQAITVAEQRLAEYEQKLRDGTGASRQAFDLITSLLETTDKDTLESIIGLIRSAAIPVAQLSKAFQEMGGAANYLKLLDTLKGKMLESVSEMERQKRGLEEQRVGIAKEIIGKRQEVEQIAGEKAQARQQVEQIMLAGKVIEQAYGTLGIFLDGVVDKLLAAGTPLTSLPEAGIRVLAGTILQVYVELYGDQRIDVQPNRNAMRLVPVPVLVSEFPGWLAPPQVYQETKEAG